MTDQFAKTLVITDPNYAPGELGVGRNNAEPGATSTDVPEHSKSTTPTAEKTFEADDLAYDPPSFEDTSWLT